MQEFKTSLDINGRMVIPAQCRKALHLKQGDTVIIRLIGDEAMIYNAKNAIEHAQNMVTTAMKGKKTLVDELISSRRLEADNE